MGAQEQSAESARIALTDNERASLLVCPDCGGPAHSHTHLSRGLSGTCDLDVMGVQVAAVEQILTARVTAVQEAALALVKRACDIECKSPGKHTGCSSHEPYRALAAMLGLPITPPGEVSSS